MKMILQRSRLVAVAIGAVMLISGGVANPVDAQTRFRPIAVVNDSAITGFDFPGAAKICDAVSPKLYTMHWSLMVKFWADPILAAHPHLSEESVVRSIVRTMEIDDDGSGGGCVSDYGYPAPDEPHQIASGPQSRKLRDVVAEVAGVCAVTPLVHGYGPLDDFTRRLQLVADCSEVSGLWINRYGNLSDKKLEAIHEVVGR